MSKLKSTLSSFQEKFASPSIMSLEEYLELCKTDKMAYANAAERMLNAIGEPTVFDTSDDPRLSKIFSNRKIRVYPSFADFFGIEDTIEQLVAYFRKSAQNLEENRQILYLSGPVGTAKSSISERLKYLMQKNPFYVLYDENEKDVELRLSPCNDSPLSLFNPNEHTELMAEYNIPLSYLNTVPSGWVLEKLKEFSGDITKFKVMKVYPSKDKQIGIMKIEPGDDNNQDISVLVGKTDLRKLEKYPQNHPYAYSYSGGLNRANQGILELSEIFKSSLKTLNPLLEATQGHSYNGTESISSMPFTGIILSHSNLTEWGQFRNNKSNEAFLDRVFMINVPYCLRITEEVKIYEKMLHNSSLRDAPIAPSTLDMLAQWSILTRLVDPQNSTLWAKLKVYDGQNVRDTMPNAKPIQEYRDVAGVDEGMTGMSTRFAFKILSQVYDLRPGEVQANPVDLMFVLEEAIKKEYLPEDTQARYTGFIKSWLQPRYFDYLEKELRTAYLDSFDSFGQNMFERYGMFAEAWINDEQCRDPETHMVLDQKTLNARLEEIERPAGIINTKDFRHEIVNYILRYKSRNAGKSPRWNEYEKIKTVLEKRMFNATENIIPVISFGAKQDAETQEKHQRFLNRMIEMGYTEGQVKLLVSWWSANKKS